MHILYIHQHFATPRGGTGTRSYEFDRRWVKAGHKVTVIAGCYDVSGLELRKKFIRKQIIDGIDLIVIGIKYSNKQSYLRRIVSFLQFTILSTYVGLRTRRADVVYATSTPLSVGVPAIVMKRLKSTPFVFEVRDQWPEVPIEMGVIKNKLVIKLLLWFEKTIYRCASSIVALSPGQAAGVRKVLVENKRVAMIPNACDTEMFHPEIDGSTIRKEYGWDDKLVLLHFGAMGKANGLDFIIDVAEKLKGNTGIHFVLFGEGSEREALLDRIKRLGSKNVEIFNSRPKVELVRIIAASDVSMVVFANFPILEHNSANKFFDSLSAGKPVLLSYSGWQREILEENQAGFGCQLCNMDEFVERVLYFNSNRQQLKKMGENARRLAVERFSRDKLAEKALEVIASL